MVGALMIKNKYYERSVSMLIKQLFCFYNNLLDTKIHKKRISYGGTFPLSRDSLVIELLTLPLPRPNSPVMKPHLKLLDPDFYLDPYSIAHNDRYQSTKYACFLKKN